jgi:nitroreductase
VTNPVLTAIRSRRVVRAMTSEPVDRTSVETILDAGRWAPTAGNRHLQRFVATTHPGTLRVLRMVSPGMIAHPAAAIIICTDRTLAAAYGFPPNAPGLFVDVGTAAATMLLAAHSIGMGAVPVSSFSRAAASVVLRLPDGVGSGTHPVSRSSGADTTSRDGATTPLALAGPDALDARMTP